MNGICFGGRLHATTACGASNEAAGQQRKAARGDEHHASDRRTPGAE
jgi:hypothetical protein